jgi:hypothetical protein
VCLHVEDADDPEIVAAWTAAGHRLVTAGRRNDPDFLARILEMIGSARRVASNRLSTAVMYAAAIGKEVAVYGPPLALGGGEGAAVDRVRDVWPELHGDTLSVADTRPAAEAELGRAHLLAPAELRSTLGWDRRVGVRAAGYYGVGSSVRKAAAVLGVARRAGEPTPDRAAASPVSFLKHPLSHLPAPLPRRLPEVPALAQPLPVRSG